MIDPANGRLSAKAGAVIAVLIGLLTMTVGPVLAQAESDAAPLTPTMVDATADDVQAVFFGSSLSAADSVSVTRSGEDVPVTAVATASESGWVPEIVFVVDTDNKNAANRTDRVVRNAILDAVDELPAASRVAVVSAGATSAVRLPLSTSRDRLDQILSQLVAERGTALIDGVFDAGRLFSTEDPSPVRSVVVVTAGGDTASTGNLSAAASGLVQSGAQLIVVSTDPSPAILENAIRQTGGYRVPVATQSSDTNDDQVGADDTALSNATAQANDTALSNAIAQAVDLARDRLIVSFLGAEPGAEPANVTVAVGDRSVTFSYPEGVLTTSSLSLAPLDEYEPGRLAFFGSPIVLYLSIVLAFCGIALAVWSLGSMFIKGEDSLERLLARYAAGEDLPDEEMQQMMVQSAMVRRAVEFTESFAERRGFLSRIEEMLERADIPVRAGEAIFFLAGAAVVVAGLIGTVTGSFFAGLLFGIILAVVGFVVIGMMAKRRLRRFEAQLPDALQLLAGTLRAGYSLPQGIDAVSKEIADPMGEELRRAVTEAQLGRELDEALGSVADRLGSDDFAWAVMAISIQREVGGNLNELLMTVSETMVQRDRLSREVAALTAEGRVSALILSLMPPGLGLVLWIMNPDYVEILFTRTMGLILLSLAVVSGLVGLLWMKKVITIDA